MADKNFNSITFPGLPDKYKVVQVADEYKASLTYAVGDIVNHLGTTYRCTTAITTEENWTAGHWTPVKIADEVTDLKSDLNYGKTATQGYILTASNEGHGSMWSPVGLPTDEQTGQAVSDWLDDHPEATTTVQDGSLTYEKLVTGTLNFVTPEMFGAKGDGITDDTQAVQLAVDTGLPVFGKGVYRIGEPNREYYYPVTISKSGSMVIGTFIDGRTYLTTSNNKNYGAFLVNADDVTIDIEISNDNNLLPDDSDANNLSDVGGYAVTLSNDVKRANVKVKCTHMSGVYGYVFSESTVQIIGETVGYGFAAFCAKNSKIDITVNGCHRACWGGAEGSEFTIKCKNFYSTGNSGHVLLCSTTYQQETYSVKNCKYTIIDTGSTEYNSGAAYFDVNDDVGGCTFSADVTLIGDVSNSDNTVFWTKDQSASPANGSICIHNHLKTAIATSIYSRHYSSINLTVYDSEYEYIVIDTPSNIMLSLHGKNSADGAVTITELGALSATLIEDYNAIRINPTLLSVNGYQFFVVKNVFTFPISRVNRCTVFNSTHYLNGTPVN